MEQIAALTDVDTVDNFIDIAKGMVRHEAHRHSLQHISACLAKNGIVFFGQLFHMTRQELLDLFLAWSPPIPAMWVENLELLGRPRRFRVIVFNITGDSSAGDSDMESSAHRLAVAPAPKFIGSGEPRPAPARPAPAPSVAQPSVSPA